jgi:class 3 adenylate cyclase
MQYLVTAQSHWRAMALLTQDEANNRNIANAKQVFQEHLSAVEQMSPPEQRPFFDRVREADARFAAASERVLAAYRAGDLSGAMGLHLSEEHPVSHELEALMTQLQSGAVQDMTEARAQFESDRGLLASTVGAFSGVSLISALLLGFVLSWGIVRPVRTIDSVLARIAGQFTQRVQVPNRDEFGTLSRNLNVTSMQLESLYNQLRSLNENLQQKVQEQLSQLERATELRRYLSPQLADSILEGKLDVNLASRRKNLTIFFSDIRGFTAMSERLEPEELSDLLNRYLSAMTEIVFKHGGTLDKYIGDAIMVFFGDPIPYQDHAERAVNMALEMRDKLAELQRQWFVRTEEVLTIGMGISTGYVTVGNIGSAARLEYTVLGNHVNLASRLASRARGGQILVSERTLEAVRHLVDATEIDQIQLEGVSRPLLIYEVNAKDALRSTLVPS